jgi:hypothetical protein
MPLFADTLSLSSTTSPVPAPVKPHTHAIFITGHGSLSSVFAKSGSFPIGIQANAATGASLGFGGRRLALAALFDYHGTLRSKERQNILYRRYSGFALGLDSRIVIKTLRSLRFFSPSLGCGLSLAGHYDKYDMIDQYMVYPVATVRPFAVLTLNRVPLLSFAIAVPISFALRAPGNYLSIGLSLEPRLRSPTFL